ncbi:MAG: DUF4443 domain-containing protein [Promethearchaeota archaeon]
MLPEIFGEFYKSPTIQPRFRVSHIVATLFIMAEQPKGIGRYRLERKIGLGSGSIKSLFAQLVKHQLIERVSSGTTQHGSMLSARGREILREVREFIPFIRKGEEFLCVGGERLCLGSKSYIAGGKQAGAPSDNGIGIRDAAIKIGAIGATCLLVDGSSLQFPGGGLLPGSDYPRSVEFLTGLVEEHQLVNGDVLVLGTASSSALARIAAVEAVSSMFPDVFGAGGKQS